MLKILLAEKEETHLTYKAKDFKNLHLNIITIISPDLIITGKERTTIQS